LEREASRRELDTRKVATSDGHWNEKSLISISTENRLRFYIHTNYATSKAEDKSVGDGRIALEASQRRPGTIAINTSN
jgi:hypothetical protein